MTQVSFEIYAKEFHSLVLDGGELVLMSFLCNFSLAFMPILHFPTEF